MNSSSNIDSFITDVFKNNRNIYDVLHHDNRIQVLVELSPRRKYLTYVMDINKNHAVLEIGSGTGAITGALADLAATVDCIEPSEQKSIANKYRNHCKDNIKIFTGTLEQTELPRQYDVVVLVGVLHQAERYLKTNSQNPQEQLLRLVRSSLKPTGKIYVAIDNRIGMSTLAGLASFESKTYTKSELETLLTSAGFGSFYYYYPFPDYLQPTIIFSDDRLISQDDVVANKVFTTSIPSTFDSAKTLKSLGPTAEQKLLANSFLVEAYPS